MSSLYAVNQRCLFGDKVRMFLREHDISPGELAVILGISRQHLYRIMNGKTEPSYRLSVELQRLTTSLIKMEDICPLDKRRDIFCPVCRGQIKGAAVFAMQKTMQFMNDIRMLDELAQLRRTLGCKEVEAMPQKKRGRKPNYNPRPQKDDTVGIDKVGRFKKVYIEEFDDEEY